MLLLSLIVEVEQVWLSVVASLVRCRIVAQALATASLYFFSGLLRLAGLPAKVVSKPCSFIGMCLGLWILPLMPCLAFMLLEGNGRRVFGSLRRWRPVGIGELPTSQSVDTGISVGLKLVVGTVTRTIAGSGIDKSTSVLLINRGGMLFLFLTTAY